MASKLPDMDDGARLWVDQQVYGTSFMTMDGKRVDPRSLKHVVERPARERSKELTEAREAYGRKLLERRLPRALHWTLDHPRALRVLLRFVSRWRPEMAIVQLGVTVSASTAVEASERWLQEQEARGRGVSGGHVFTYTDASGLPAEVYGP